MGRGRVAGRCQRLLHSPVVNGDAVDREIASVGHAVARPLESRAGQIARFGEEPLASDLARMAFRIGKQTISEARSGVIRGDVEVVEMAILLQQRISARARSRVHGYEDDVALRGT